MSERNICSILEFFLLLALQQKDSYPTELHSLFQKIGNINVELPTIGKCLSNMEEKGWVQSSVLPRNPGQKGRPLTYYSVLEPGRKELNYFLKVEEHLKTTMTLAYT